MMIASTETKSTISTAPPVTIHKLLSGQKAMVTGANSGIGKGVAIALGEAGADVVVNYVEGDDAAAAVVDEIGQFGVRAYAHKADVSSEDQVAAMFVRMIKEFGTIDILVNNAGLQRDSAFSEMTLEKWNKVLGVNLTGQFLCAREAVREFLRRGVVPSVSSAAGKIICMSSVHQEIPWAGHANYATSKGGIKLLMESMAQELAPKRIRVNAIAPGAIRTPINTAAWNTEGGVRSADDAGALWAHRRARGYRTCGSMAGFGSFGLCRRHDAFRRWRHDAVPRLCHGRLRIRPCPITTTSSSSAAAPAELRSPTGWLRPANESCCSSAATTCRGRQRTGIRRPCSWTRPTRRRKPGSAPTAGAFIRACITMSAAIPRSTARHCFGCASGISTRSSTRTASLPRGR